MALSTKAAARLGKLLPTSTALFVCDIQERFRPIISGFPAVVDTSRRMVRIDGSIRICLQWQQHAAYDECDGAADPWRKHLGAARCHY